MSFIYCHLNFHANLWRSWHFPFRNKCKSIYFSKLFNVEETKGIFHSRIYPACDVVQSVSYNISALISCNFIIKNYVNCIITSYIYLLIFTISLLEGPLQTLCFFMLIGIPRWLPLQDIVFTYDQLVLISCNFIIKNYVNCIITSYIYLLIFTISLWLHVKHFIALTKRKSVRRFFF
jgi:hypothetical protein